MEVGLPGTGGAGTADPKPKLLEHLRACPTWNPATSASRHAERTSGMGQLGAMGARGQRHSPQGTRAEAPNLG